MAGEDEVGGQGTLWGIFIFFYFFLANTIKAAGSGRSHIVSHLFLVSHLVVLRHDLVAALGVGRQGSPLRRGDLGQLSEAGLGVRVSEALSVLSDSAIPLRLDYANANECKNTPTPLRHRTGMQSSFSWARSCLSFPWPASGRVWRRRSAGGQANDA